MQYSVVIIIPGYNKEEAANTKKMTMMVNDYDVVVKKLLLI